MDDTQRAIDQAKQKLEETLTPIRKKVELSFLGGMAVLILFSFIFAWASRFKFPFAYFPVIILIIGVFRFKSELRKTLWQDYYENELKSLEKEPENADDYCLRGRILARLDFPEAALENYQKALSIEPDNEMYLDELAYFLWNDLKDGERALPYIEKLCEIEGDNQADAFMYRGQVLGKTDPDVALKSFDRAIEIDPDDSDYPLAKIRFLIDAGRLEQATDYLPEVERIVKKERAYGQWPINEIRARLALKQDDFETAVKFVSKALRFVPRSDLYQLRGEAYDALGQMDKAAADRLKAEQLEENI